MDAVDFDGLTRKYVALRDKKEEIAAAHKKELAKYTEVLNKLDALFLEYLNEHGLQNLTTKHATVFKGVRTSVSVADKEVFLKHVLTNEEYDLLDVRASKSIVKDMFENGEDVPGVNLRQEQYTRVNRK
jgi:hypothetical protein